MGNICGKTEDTDLDTNSKHDKGENDAEVNKKWKMALSNVLLASKNALRQMETYGDDFVQVNFRSNLTQHLKETEDQYFQWYFSREEIPKTLMNPVSKTFLEELDSAATLCRIESWLQKMAIVLQSVSQDLESSKESFAESFMESRDFVNATLTEARVAMTELNVCSNYDVPDSLIPKEVWSNSNQSYRSFRNWIVYRDTRNAFECIVQILNEQIKNVN